MNAGELNATHIGRTISFGEVSEELRQIYHEGDYPHGLTYVCVGEAVREFQLYQNDPIRMEDAV
ncbi:hypothetical protein [Nocardia jiangxiensis]|uniref:hypothetical protein n=1 Tax=Nocardia jiangxiensis TaxID=282685 RepID=UPI0002D960A2|nr:hypothetical protein [Nocardia jiangxiensis]